MTLKLPAMPQGTARQFAHMNVRAPLVEANARMAMFNSIGVPVAAAAQEYVARENKREVEAEELFMIKAAAEYEEQYEAVEKFDITNVKDPHLQAVAGEVAPDKSSIEGYRLYPESAKRNYASKLEESQARISDPNSRKSFGLKHQAINLESWASNSVKAQGKQYAAMHKQTKDIYNEMLGSKHYWGAINVMEESDHPDKQAFINNAHLARQRGRFEDVIGYAIQASTDEDISDEEVTRVLNEELVILKEEVPDWTDKLLPREIKQYEAAIQGQIRAMKTRKDQENVANSAMYTKRGNQVIEQLGDGRYVSPNTTNNVVDDLISTGKGSSKVKAMEVRMAQAQQPLVKTYDSVPMAVQNSTMRIIQGSLDSGYAPDGRELTLNDKEIMEGALGKLEKSNTDRRADPVKWARDRNVATVGTFDVSDPVTINNRQSLETVLEENHGRAGAYLTKEETLQVQDHVNSLSANGKAEYVAGLLAGLGGDAEALSGLLDDFKDTTTSSIWAVAGQRAINGDPADGQAIMKGQEILDNKPDILKGANKKVGDWFNENLGGSFGYNQKEQSSRVNATMAAYAYLKGGVDNLFEEDKLDEDVMKKAVDIATGGIVKYNGVNMVTPVRGWTDANVENFMNDLTPKFLTDTGLSSNLDPLTTLNNIKDGSIRLVPLGQNRFALRQPDGTVLAGGRRRPGNERGTYIFQFKTPQETTSRNRQMALDELDYRKDVRELQDRKEEDEYEARTGRTPLTKTARIVGKDMVKIFSELIQTGRDINQHFLEIESHE